jgi:peroxiredoxin Q/BCP
MELKKGDIIPNFKAKDSNGNDFDTKLVGKAPLFISIPKTH